MNASNDDARSKETLMELRQAEVDHRIGELRAVARTLRDERRRSGGGRWLSLRVALGRRLVALGTALLDGAAAGARVRVSSR